MQKQRPKEREKYVDKLDEEAKRLYYNKRSILNKFDPYNSVDSAWSADLNLIPPVDFPALTSYLVCAVKAYTLEEFRRYKSLEAHVQFTDGLVMEPKMHVPYECSYVVVMAKVLNMQHPSERPFLPWVVLIKSGDVADSHCNCMADLCKTCTHIGALLFKIEAVVRVRQKTTLRGKTACQKNPHSVEKEKPEAGHKTDSTSAPSKRKNLDRTVDDGQGESVKKLRTSRASASSRTEAPTEECITAFFDALVKTGDKPVVLSAVPEYCKDFIDPAPPVNGAARNSATE